MATDTIDNLEEAEEEFVEEPAGAPERTGPYTIAGRVGDDLEAQVRRADWHCAKMAENEVLLAVLAAPIAEEIERLQARLKAAVAPFQQKRDWHSAQVEWWVLNEGIRDKIAKTVNLAHGVVKTTQTRGKTEVKEDVVLCLYADDPKAYGDLVKPNVDTKAVRERFSGPCEERAGGGWVYTDTGEIVHKQVIVQTEDPRISVQITALGPGRDVAEE